MTNKRLELRVFGPLEIQIDGEPLRGLVSAKARALLVYLALARRACSRSHLAGLMWSDLPEEDARRNLRVEFQKLRRGLSPYLNFTHQSAALFADSPHRVDALEFERLQRPGPDRDLWAAADLYRGPFLQDFQIRAAPLFEEWLLLESERHRQAALSLLDGLVQQAMERGDLERGLPGARRLLEIDTWRETSHRHLMRLLALSGDRSAALAQYEICRRTLSQELGVEPSPETSGLAEQIRSGAFSSLTPLVPAVIAPPARTTIPHNLPAPIASFVGREDELEQAMRLLHEPGCRLLSLVGAGGAGKTRLALELGWRLLDQPAAPFPDGVYFASLEAVHIADLLALTLLAALGVPVANSRDPLQQLVEHFRDKQALLVVDNFEQLGEAAPLLTHLLQGAARLKLLVTSRQRLDLYEEWVFPVEGLSVPGDEPMGDWNQYSALRLFQERARRVNLRFSLEDQLSGVARLCQVLEGLPLGIELAAAWVHALSCQNLLESIQRQQNLPESPYRNIPPRQRSLRAVFQSSWDLLADHERSALGRVSLFRGGFSASAAQDALQVQARWLASLVGKSLLRMQPDGRYTMHTLLQSFAGESQEMDEREQLREAHSRYFAAFLDERRILAAGPDEPRAITEIGTEIDNIRAGWEWAVDALSVGVESCLEILGRYLTMLDTFYTRMSWYREAETVFARAAHALEQALPEDKAQPSRLRFVWGHTLMAHGRACYYLGQYEIARSLLQHSQQLLDEHAPSAQMATTCQLLGLVEENSGNYAGARAAFEQGLALYRGLDEPTGIAACSVSLGNLAKRAGDLDAAADLYRQALQVFHTRGDQRGIWVCLINLGNIANVRQDYPLARQLYEQGFAALQDTPDAGRRALTLLNLGSVEREIGAYPQAVEHYRQSLEISLAVGEKRVATGSLDGLGKTYLKQGDLEQARRHLLQALDSAWQAGLVPQALDSLCSLASLAAAEGDRRRAAGLLALVLGHTATPYHVRQEAESVQASLGLDAGGLELAALFASENSLEKVVRTELNG